MGRRLRGAGSDRRRERAVRLKKLRQSSGSITAKAELDAMKAARGGATPTATKQM